MVSPEPEPTSIPRAAVPPHPPTSLHVPRITQDLVILVLFKMEVGPLRVQRYCNLTHYRVTYEEPPLDPKVDAPVRPREGMLHRVL